MDERRLHQIQSKLRGHISFSMESLAAHGFGEVQEEEVRNVVEALDRIVQSLAEQHSGLQEKMEALNQHKALTMGFLRQVTEMQESIGARLASLQKIQTSLRDERTSVEVNLRGDLTEELLVTVVTFLRHCAERRVALTKEESNLAKFRQNVLSLDVLCEKIRHVDVGGLEVLIERFRAYLLNMINELSTSDNTVSSFLENQISLLEWVKECLQLSDEIIPEKISRMENGEGWSTILTETEEVGREKPTLSLDSFGRLTDTLVRRWEDELIMAEDRVEGLKERAAVLSVAEAGLEDGYNVLLERLQHKLSKLQKTFEDHKVGLFDLGGGVETLLIQVYSIESSIESILSTIRSRYFLNGSPRSEEGKRAVTPSSIGGHLVIIGHDAVDSRNVRNWIKDQIEAETNIRTRIAPRLEEVEGAVVRLDEKCAVLVKGLAEFCCSRL
ncbi:hypothetical protein BC829DRAFT_255881 [Chytridium lagenaria]|nr:hypothetical protein BC829DRAFT_255881 [Chytridium lagenaria]